MLSVSTIAAGTVSVIPTVAMTTRIARAIWIAGRRSAICSGRVYMTVCPAEHRWALAFRRPKHGVG